MLVPVRVSKDNLGKWGTSARVMNDVLDNSLDIAVPELVRRVALKRAYLPLLLDIVKSSEPGRRHLVCFVRRKDKTTTVSLRCKIELVLRLFESVCVFGVFDLPLIHLPMINMNLLLKIIIAHRARHIVIFPLIKRGFLDLIFRCQLTP